MKRNGAALVGVMMVMMAAESRVEAADEGMKTASVLVGGHFEVEPVYDVPYVEGPDADPKKHKLDLYLPKGQKGVPVLFFIHGGGWTTGDRKMYGAVGRVFAKNGVATVVVSYRLTPQVTHPSHARDVAKAFAWTHRNIAKYGGRPDRVFVSGQSAGGHLAALLATNERFLQAEGLTLKDIRAAMPVSGIYQFPPGLMKRMLGDDKDAPRDASPLRHVTGKEPPFLILYADNDFPGCGRMSEKFRDALAEKKVEVLCDTISGRNHITIMLRLMFNEADPATQALLKFIAAHSELKLAPRTIAAAT